MIEGPDGALTTPPGGFENAAASDELPCSLLADVVSGGGPRWLIEGLWAREGLGLIAGSPKTGKTWLALDIAVSVASGQPALGRFAVPKPGPVLIYPAEDRPGAVRDRVDGICHVRNLDLATLPLHILTAETLRLDEQRDRTGLERVLARLRPELLLLDPLVRLHGGDENSATHVSQLFGYLRALQRRFALSIIVTHHISKRTHAHPGQGLRGSSDLHAVGDSNIFLQRQKDAPTRLTVEHRFASSPEPLALHIVPEPGGGAHLEVGPLDASADEADEKPTPPGRASKANPVPGPVVAPLTERVSALLRACERPLSQVKIRKALRVRNAELTVALRQLQVQGAIETLGRMGGWRTAAAKAPTETQLAKPRESDIATGAPAPQPSAQSQDAT